MRRIRVLALVMAMMAPGTGATQEASKLDPVVVTATKSETPASQLGAAVTVITDEDFRTYHYETVDDALRAVPGVEIRRSGSLGKTSSITIRGANANQIQVLVDGVRVKSPTLGQAELSDLSPDLIDRIEIIRGPLSGLYGADAIGGVVNIITKRGQGAPSGSISQEAGNYDTYRSRAQVSGSYKLFDYAFGGSHLESNGQFKNDDSDQNALNLRLGLTLPHASSVSLAVRWNRTDTGLPVKFLSTQPFGTALPIDPFIDSNNRNLSETYVLSLSGHTRPVTWWESEARFGRYTNKINFIDLPDRSDECPFPPCEFPQRLRVERNEAEWLNHFHAGTWSTSTIGLEHRRVLGDSQNATVFHAVSETVSGFVQEQLRLFDRLFITGSVRVEGNDFFGRNTTERGSLAYAIKEWGTRLRGGAGTGFRAPTLNDLFFPGFSDKTLKPEKSLSYDAGVDQQLFDKRLRVGLTYFQNNFSDLISFVGIATPPFVKGVNAGKARAAGIELTADADILDTLRASLNYTYTDSKILARNQLIPREPRHRWNAVLTWEPMRRLTVFTEAHIVSEQWESTATGADPRLGVFNSGHTRIDVGGTWRLMNRYAFIQSVDLIARVQNVLNEGYAEVRGFPALGINGLVGLRASF